MREKYDLVHDNIGFLISLITDNIVRFAAKVLSCKLLRNMQPTKYTTETVEVVELYAKGVQINWSQYMLNELLDDASQVQEDSKALFHYS